MRAVMRRPTWRSPSPGHAGLMFRHGQVLERLARWDDARAAYRGAADAMARAYLGSVPLAMGDAEAAIAALREAIALRHDVPYARSSLAGALRSRGRREEAAALYREILRADPSDALPRAGLEALGTEAPGP